MKKIEHNDSEHEDFADYTGQEIEITWSDGEKTLEKVAGVNFPTNDPVAPEYDNCVQLELYADEWIGHPPFISFVYDNPQDESVEGKWECSK